MKVNKFKLFILNNFLLGAVNAQSVMPVPATNIPEYYRFNADSNLFLSPEVAAFQKYNFLEVNQYTGKSKIEIPLYTILDGSINIPINLTYNSGGIKVDDVASSVGMNWNINAGGSTIRSIKDIDDHEYDEGNFSWTDRGFESDQYVEDYYYISVEGYLNEEVVVPPRYSNPTIIEGISKKDASPDIFTAVAPGLNTKFYLEKSGVGYLPKFLDGNGIKALPTERRIFNNIKALGFDNRNIYGIENIHTILPVGGPKKEPWIIEQNRKLHDYTDFQLTNTEGVLYSFSTPEVTEVISSYAMGGSGEGLHSAYLSLLVSLQKGIIKSHKFNISAWNLNSMYDYKTNRKVDFEYEQFSKPTIYSYKNNTNDVLRSDVNPSLIRTGKPDISAFGHIPDFQDKEFVNVDEIDLKNQAYYTKGTLYNRLLKIKWSQGIVEFKYDLVRLDNYDNEKALTEVIIKNNNNQVVKNYRFNYGYMNSKENCNEWKCKRLILNGIDLISHNDNKEVEKYYQFEYDLSYPLPKVNSLQQDYLGYYNNNGVEKGNVKTDIKSPTLYYHKEQGRFSILPFQRQDGTFTKEIPGHFNLKPNEYSLVGLLKKIVYPTGGFSEFEYENHRFILQGYEYVAGGARIKTQNINDGVGNNRVLNYEYTEDGKSSGYVNNFPVFGYPWGYDHKKRENNVSFITYDKPKGLIELTDGSYVGYSRVVVREKGNGYMEYNFTSPKDYPNERDFYKGTSYIANKGGEVGDYIYSEDGLFLINNSSFPDLNYVDNEIRRNKLNFIKTYNQNNTLIQEKKYTYNYKLLHEIPLDYQVVLDHYTPASVYGPAPSNSNYGFKGKLKVERNLLSEEDEINFDVNGQSISKKVNYNYHSSYPFVLEKKYINSDGSEVLNAYGYMIDEPRNEVSELLKNQNRLGELSEVSLFKDSKVLSKSKINYSKIIQFNANGPEDEHRAIIQPKNYLEAKGNSNMEEIISYDKYDQYGNLLQYTKKGSIPVSLIWGYDGSQVILKFEGIDYDSLMGNGRIAFLIDDAIFESREINSGRSLQTFELLRKETFLKNILVTSSTYQPLIGIMSITPSNGQSEFYEYDDFGRLIKIYNEQKEVLKTFNYHYSTN